MRSALGPRLIWISVALWVVLLVFGLVATVTAESLSPEDDPSNAGFLVAGLAAVVTGAIVAARKPKHPVGWMLLAYAFSGAVGSAFFGLAAMSADAGMQTAAAWFEGLGIALYTASFVLIPASVLLFPNGDLPSPRWRPVGWAMALAAGTGFFAALLNGGFGGDSDDAIFGPVVSESYADVVDGVSFLSFVFLVLSVLGAVASLIVRFRRSNGEEHQQMKWVTAAALFLAITIVVVVFEAGAGSTTGWVTVLLAAGLASIPTAMGFAILKYRLYDIDVVISKSVAYLGLAALITLLYAAVVIGPLLIIGLPDDGGPGLALPIVATAVVAVLFEPIRSRMERWADRLVYGQRSTPHDVLSQVTARLSETTHGTGTTDLARLVAEGTGADQAVVWVWSGETMRPEGVWPPDQAHAIQLIAGSQPAIDDEFTATTPVQHGDDLLGSLSITKPRNDPVTPTDAALLADVAAGAGLLLRNISLNNELRERAQEVRASRQRLIAAQDAERHRLERDLHDGAQQQVVALKVKLGLAKTIAEREGADEIASLVTGLADETQEAVDALRSVAHGIYPPLLEAEGLIPALEALGRSAPIPVEIEMANVGRYARPIEETVYFCVLEVITQTATAGVRHAQVSIRAGDSSLAIDATYDATPHLVDLTAVKDRTEAADGTIETAPSADATRILVTMPTRQLEMT